MRKSFERTRMKWKREKCENEKLHGTACPLADAQSDLLF